MTVDRELAFKLAEQILQHQAIITSELTETSRIDGEKARILADLRDYFLYIALQAERKESEELVRLLEGLELKANIAGDRFHAGFFFTLTQLISLRYEVRGLPGEKITYLDWN